MHARIQTRRYGFGFRENCHLIPIILLETNSDDSPALDLLRSSSVKVMYLQVALGQVKHPERSKFTVTSRRYRMPICIEFSIVLLQKRRLEEAHVTAISERRTYSTRNSVHGQIFVPGI